MVSKPVAYLNVALVALGEDDNTCEFEDCVWVDK